MNQIDIIENINEAIKHQVTIWREPVRKYLKTKQADKRHREDNAKHTLCTIYNDELFVRCAYNSLLKKNI